MKHPLSKQFEFVTSVSAKPSINRFFTPFIMLKRFLFAMYDALARPRKTYAQHGEDSYIQEQLNELGVDIRHGIYVDIGANQPTQISNTYLFYRAGGSGIAIEPNPNLEKLYKRIRPRDNFLRIGCSNVPSVLPFRHSSSSVLSGFGSGISDVTSTEYLPLFPLDNVLQSFNYEFIYLLSIDVEGMDLQVLQGAEKALEKALFVIVENNFGEKNISDFMNSHGFIQNTQMGANIIFSNTTILMAMSNTSVQ